VILSSIILNLRMPHPHVEAGAWKLWRKDWLRKRSEHHHMRFIILLDPTCSLRFHFSRFAQEFSLSSTEHSFLIRFNTQQIYPKNAPLISNSSDEYILYFAIIRRHFASNDSLPPLKTCGIAWVFLCLNESSVAHHQPKL
jgi:hypothetical protein